MRCYSSGEGRGGGGGRVPPARRAICHGEIPTDGTHTRTHTHAHTHKEAAAASIPRKSSGKNRKENIIGNFGPRNKQKGSRAGQNFLTSFEGES